MELPKRGATINPPNRFERLEMELDGEFAAEGRNPATQYLIDSSQTIVSYNNSPDIGFEASINAYRGCEHGCSYCYARPYHEYLGFSAGIDFETKIMVKPSAPELLRKELSSSKWEPQTLAMSGVTDCYQPIERKLELTRRCLQVLADFRNPVGIVTKNHLVTRDIDLLKELARFDAAVVFISITTLDPELARRLEPRASTPNFRLDAIQKLNAAGIRVGVLVAPVIPGLNEHEIPAILRAAREAGARHAGYTMLRLPYGVKDIFSAWLEQHMPEAKEKVLGRIRSMRKGKLNNSDYASRMRGEGPLAEQIAQLFKLATKRERLNERTAFLSSASFRHPAGQQMNLF